MAFSEKLNLRASPGQNLGQIEMWKQKFPPINFVNIKTVKYLDGMERTIEILQVLKRCVGYTHYYK